MKFLATVIAIVLLGVISCGDDSRSSSSDSQPAVVGTWTFYATSNGLSGNKVEDSGLTGNTLTIRSDATFYTNMWVSNGLEGTWWKTGGTYYLSGNDGRTREVHMHNGELYGISGNTYYWATK